MSTATGQKISDVRAAQKQEKEPKSYKYQLLQKNSQSLTDSLAVVPEYPPYVSLPSPVTVYYEGGTRQMRYIDGHPSIWVDEQKDAGKEMIESPANVVSFADGQIILQPFEKNKKLFLDLHPWNEAVKQRVRQTTPKYKLINEAKEVEAKASQQKLMKEAMDKAYKMDDANMIAHARELGIVIYELEEKRDTEVIRSEYIDYAMTNPSGYLNTTMDPVVRLRMWIWQLIDNGDIALDTASGMAQFVSPKKNIVKVPEGTADLCQYLCEFVNTEEGATFATDVKKKQGS